METVSAKHSAVRSSSSSSKARSAAVRASRAPSPSNADSEYRRLSAAFHRYTDDVPEDSFPTLLESLFLEAVVEPDRAA